MKTNFILERLAPSRLFKIVKDHNGKRDSLIGNNEQPDFGHSFKMTEMV